MIVKEKYFRPKTIEEAVSIAGEYGKDFCFMAGGTDVMVNKFQGNNSTSCLIDITDIGEMKQIVKSGKFLKIGAALPLDELSQNADIKREFPLLIEVAQAIAGPVIRKTATIGGNLLCENRCSFYNQSEWWREAAGHCLKCEGDVCIATGGKKNCFSKFVSDMAVALISMNAWIEVIEPGGGYMAYLEDMYSGNGVNPRKLKRDSLIKSIYIPVSQKFQSVFLKLRPRESMDFGSLTSAVTIDKNGKIKIVLGCIDPGPIIVHGNSNDNRQEMIRKALKKARIVDNDFYSRKYRKEMIAVFLERSFVKLLP